MLWDASDLYQNQKPPSWDVNNQSIKCFRSLSIILSIFQTSYGIGSAELISKFVYVVWAEYFN
jgi:hypothetical protein